VVYFETTDLKPDQPERLRRDARVDSHLSCPDALLSTALMAAFSRFVHPGDSQFRVH
jgi:hypothetical protein